MTKNETILERIKKLLALSKSDNVNEAAAAAAKAQALASRYQIDLAMASLEVESAQGSTAPSFTVGTHLVYKGGTRLSFWIWILASDVCTANRLKPYQQQGDIYGIGDVEGVQVAGYLIGWLIGEVERLEKIERRKLRFAMGKGESKRWGNAFRVGCAQTVASRIRKQYMETISKLSHKPAEDDYRLATEQGSEAILALDKQTRYALALTNLSEQYAVAIEVKSKEIGLRSTGYSGSATSGDGLRRGREAGNRANLGGRSLPG